MGSYMNKYQKIPEYQQAENPQWDMQRNKNVPIRQETLSVFCLVPRPPIPQMTHWKHRRMTHLIQVQGKTKQTSVGI